jgi:hypothetical protein
MQNVRKTRYFFTADELHRGCGCSPHLRQIRYNTNFQDCYILSLDSRHCESVLKNQLLKLITVNKRSIYN